jgi:hypothetical protein
MLRADQSRSRSSPQLPDYDSREWERGHAEFKRPPRDLYFKITDGSNTCYWYKLKGILVHLSSTAGYD